MTDMSSGSCSCPRAHDPDTLVAAEGAEAFESRLQSALPLSEYLVQQLSSEVDLGHDEGRAKLKDLAVPLFARMPDGIYREMVLERLSRHVGMPAGRPEEENGGGRGGTTGRAFGGRRPAGPRTGCRPAVVPGVAPQPAAPLPAAVIC